MPDAFMKHNATLSRPNNKKTPCQNAQQVHRDSIPHIDSKEIFGAEIQYFRLDPRYWETVLDRFQDSGLRCVSTYVQWRTHLVGPPDKRHPAGILDFDGRTDPSLNLLRFLDLIHQRGLNLNFRCGPFCCNEMVHGGYPPWLVLGDPKMMVWDSQNRTTQGYWIGKKEGSQPSYLHPDYLVWCEKWLTEVDAIIQPRLASRGGCITMLNLDNEISYIVRDGFLDSDYNPVNVAPGGYWHQFLQGKYGSRVRLVDPPRHVPEEVGRDLPLYLDWIEFKTWVMTEYIRRLRAIHESNGVSDVTFMTNFNPHRPEGVPTRMPAFEEALGKRGIAGYDFYRGVFMSYSGYHSMARVLKLMNATLKYTWSAEFMSGTWNKLLGNTRVSDDHMRFMARCALAQGCKSICWFMFHDRDCWGDAPVSSHGHARTSLEVLRETPRILFKEIRNWDALVPRMDVAVIYDLIQHQHTAIGDPMPCADNALHVGRPVIDAVSAGKSSAEYEGLFRLIEQCGVQAGAVDILCDPERLEDFPMAFLPGSAVIERRALKTLRKYVARGGILVVTGPLPRRDERGRMISFLAPDQFIWHSEWIAQDPPEEEDLENIHKVSEWMESQGICPHVRLRPSKVVSWVDWQDGGGHREFRQPRNLGSAILHEGAGETVLFVLNHYCEAARFLVEFGRHSPRHLVNLSTGAVHLVKSKRVELDIDRKSAEIYRVVFPNEPRKKLT